MAPMMPHCPMHTDFADCCCGGREWLGTEVLWGGSVRARLSPENSPACTQLPKAALYSRALRGGVRMIETGANYGTEVAVGEGIRDSGVARNEIFVISKVSKTTACVILLSLYPARFRCTALLNGPPN
eukprot:scaffold67185_cov30-Tisochrysis_lutea.AAC.3